MQALSGMTSALAAHLSLPSLSPLLETKNATLHYCLDPPTLVSSSIRPPGVSDVILARRAKALASPSHPAILPILRVTTIPEKDVVVVVLKPPCPRLTRLTSHLRARGPFGHEKGTAMAERLLSALQELRDCGLLHTALSIDHVLLGPNGDLFVVPTLQHGTDDSTQDDGAVAKASANCIYVFYTGFVRRSPQERGPFGNVGAENRELAFPDHVSDNVKQIILRLRNGDRIEHVLQEPLFLEMADHGSSSIDSVTPHAAENECGVMCETTNHDRASQSHCSASSDKMSAVTASETITGSDYRVEGNDLDQPKAQMPASSASSTSSCSADDSPTSQCVTVSADSSPLHLPANTSVVSTTSTLSATCNSSQDGWSQQNCKLKSHNSPNKLKHSKKARSKSTSTRPAPVTPPASRFLGSRDRIRSDHVASPSTSMSSPLRSASRPASPSVKSRQPTSYSNSRSQTPTSSGKMPPTQPHNAVSASDIPSTLTAAAPSTTPQKVEDVTVSTLPVNKSKPRFNDDRPYGAARLMTPSLNRSGGQWRGRLDAASKESSNSNNNAMSAQAVLTSVDSAPVVRNLSASSVELSKIPQSNQCILRNGVSDSKHPLSSSATSKSPSSSPDNVQGFVQSYAKQHMLAATAGARPDGAARLMSPNAHRPLGQWRGRITDVAAASDNVESINSDGNASSAALWSSTPSASLPVASAESKTLESDVPSSSKNAIRTGPSTSLDDKLTELLTSLKDPNLGVQLVQFKKGTLFRRSPAGTCFTGAAASAWIAAYLRIGRKEACEVGQKLLTAKTIRHVSSPAVGSGRNVEPHKFRDSPSEQYVFVEDRRSNLPVPSLDFSDSASSESLSLQSSSHSCSSGNPKDRPVLRESGLISALALRGDLKPSPSGSIGSKQRVGCVARSEVKQPSRSNGPEDQPMSLSNLASMLLPVHAANAATGNSAPGTVLNGKWNSWDGHDTARDPITVTASLLSELRDICGHFAFTASSPSVSSSSSSEPSTSHLTSANDVLFNMDPCDDMLMDSAITSSVPIASTLSKRSHGIQGLGIDSLHVEPAQRVPHVNIECLQASPEFARFERATAELQAVDLESLNTRSAKAAFAINLYNLLSLHARITCRSPSNRIERSRINHRIAYRVGGDTYFSLDDILNIILRGEHRRGISKLIQRSSRSTDAEWHRRLAVQPVMPEALCAVSVTWSSYDPPIHVYSSENLSVQLADVLDRFLCMWVRPRLSSSKAGVARVPRIFNLFANDFVSDRTLVSGKAPAEHVVAQAILAWISEHIRSNAGLADRVSQCQHLEYYRLGDAFDASSSGSFAPFFWDS